MAERAPASIAAGHPLTAEAACEALRAGGNAYDAVVAAGFAAAMCEPGLTSLGGGGFLLAHTASSEEILFDFFVDTPGRGRDGVEPSDVPITIKFKAADQVFHVGHGTVAVPGCLSGYLHVHDRLGRLELGTVTAPARRLANEGVVVNAQQAQILALLVDIFGLTEEGADVYQVRGRAPIEGDRLCNHRYGAFLDEIASGRVRSFADGAHGTELDALTAANGGLLSLDDLDAYRVIEREPLVLNFADARVATNPPPCFGGELVAQALETLDGAQPDEPNWYTALARALIAVVDRHRSRPRSSRGTTHVSVCDHDGNVASMTTSNGSCSGVLVPETGVQLNNIMGEEDLQPVGRPRLEPGFRVGSMMAPSVLVPAGGPVIAVGSGGSERIRSALTQVIAALAHRPEALAGAVEAPRVHWDGSVIQVEPGLSEETLSGLAEVAPVNVWSSRDLYFGGAHAATTDGRAAGDPRRGGSTAVVR